MDTILDPITELQDKVIETIEGLKKPVSSAVADVVEFVVDRVPEVPALPYAQKLPTPVELIDNQAKFAARVVSSTKSVAKGAAKAAAPLTDQLLDRPAPAPKAAKATKKVMEAVA